MNCFELHVNEFDPFFKISFRNCDVCNMTVLHVVSEPWFMGLESYLVCLVEDYWAKIRIVFEYLNFLVEFNGEKNWFIEFFDEIDG